MTCITISDIKVKGTKKFSLESHQELTGRDPECGAKADFEKCMKILPPSERVEE